MTRWEAISTELARWEERGLCARFWWRDDDAIRPTPRLKRLIDVAAGRPLALAVISANADATLFELMTKTPNFSLVQHGYAHRNWRPAGEKKAEYGPERPAADVEAEIASGWARLCALNADASGAGSGSPRNAISIEDGSLVPVFVPPWNRMDPSHFAALARAGFRAVSLYGPRRAQFAASFVPRGLAIVNTHLDPVDWRGSRGFVGLGPALKALLAALESRRHAHERAGGSEAGDLEPIGVLTHHLVHDNGVWRFLGQLVEHIECEPGARWIDVREAIVGG